MRARWTVVVIASSGAALLVGSLRPDAAVAAALLAAIVAILATSGRPGRTRRRRDRHAVPPPPAPPMPIADGAVEAAQLDSARRLIEEAAHEGIIGADVREDLLRYIYRRQLGSLPASPIGAERVTLPVAAPAPRPPAAATAADMGADRGSRPDDTAVDRPVVEARFERLKKMVASDVAVHGLAYLGVLLLFAGSFGFMVFSFGSVRVGVRPLAEISMPTVLLGSAWFLRRRGAPFVATALGLLGGLLLPITMLASFVDGVPFPPELHGTALAVTSALVAVALSGAYAAYAVRHPDASLRYLVAPMIWVALWAVGLVVAPATTSVDLRRWSAGQLALVAVGVALTTGVARFRPRGRFSAETQTAGIFGAIVSYPVTLLFAGTEGWPTVPVVAAGVATIVVVELLNDRIGGRDVVAVIQTVLMLVTASALIRDAGVPWTGAAVVVASVGLLEWQRWRSADVSGLWSAAAGLAVGLMLASTGLDRFGRAIPDAGAAHEPWAAVAAFGAASLWAHARRSSFGEVGTQRALSAAAALLPVGIAAGLFDACPDDLALLVVALIVVSLVVVQRATASRDDLYAWWIPAVAGATVYGTVAVAESQAASWLLVCAAALGAVALAGARWPPGAAVWTAAAGLVWAGELARRVVGWESTWAGVVLAGAGLLVMVVATRRPALAWAHHASGVAVVISAAALALASDEETARFIAVSAWAATWLVVVVGYEFGRAPLIDLAAGRSAHVDDGVVRRRLAGAAVAVLGASIPFVVAGVGREMRLLDEHRSWTGVAMSLVAVMYGGIARLLVRRRPLAPVAAASAFALAIVGVSIAAPDPWPTILALSAPIVITVEVGGALRRPVMTWLAWLASAVLAVLLASRAGVTGHNLAVVVTVWGAAVAVGGLLLDDRLRGRRAAGEGVRLSWLVAPVVLGAVAVPAGLGFLFDAPLRVAAVWSLAAAAFYTTVAMLLRAGSVTAASYALVTFSVAVLAPGDPYGRPWTFAPWALVLLAISTSLRVSGSDHLSPWLRWDVAPLVVAHGVAFVALARAVDIDAIPATWISFGALSGALSVARRNAAWGLAGAALLIVGAGVAGPGWLALALAVTGVASAMAAARATGAVRTALQLAATTSLVFAWAEFLVWEPWETAVEAWATAVGAAALLVTASAAVRHRVVASDWLVPACLLAVSAFTWVGLHHNDGTLGARESAWMFAVGLGSSAVSSAIVARPLRVDALRDTSAVLTATALGSAGVGWGVDVGPAVAACVGLGVSTMLLALALSRGPSPTAWLRPLAVFSGTMTAGAVALALAAWPRTDLLEAALVAIGLEAAAVGVLTHRPEPVGASPVLLCVAWMLFASHTLEGETQWFTVPIGLATLAVVAVLRDVRRSHEMQPATQAIVVMDIVGMAFVVGASLVETLTVSPIRGLFAIGFGAAIAGWGAYTRVRRRAVFGAGTVVLAAALMLAGPLARIVPAIEGPAVWVALVGAGVVVIAVASGLERGKATLNAAVRRAEELTRGWE